MLVAFVRIAVIGWYFSLKPTDFVLKYFCLIAGDQEMML